MAETNPLPPNRRGVALLKILLPMLLLVGVVFGVRQWLWLHSHESTDNAQVASDLVQISPQVVGIVAEVFVSENEAVEAGQLLARLDDSKLRAAVDAAQANLEAAIADAEAAGVDIEFTKSAARSSALTAKGSDTQAQAGISAARAGIGTAEAGVRGSDADVEGAQSSVDDAAAQIRVARQALSQSKTAAVAARAQLSAAQAAAAAAKAAISAAEAQEALAKRDLDRMRTLEHQGAVSRQQLDQGVAREAQSASSLQVALEQLRTTEATVEQRKAEVESADAAVGLAAIGVQRAELHHRSAQQQAAGARARAEFARQQVASAQAGLDRAHGVATQAAAEESRAQGANLQIGQRRAAWQQARAKVDQARAALASAQLDLSHAKIVAPRSGRVSKKLVAVGDLVAVGQPLMSLVPAEGLYVLANFKETQMANIRKGEPVTIELDAFPGRTIQGRVDSTSAATGSTFALLPPDNATGNFVKVVQRVPVKVRFVDGVPLGDVRVGMSALVTVAVK